MPLPGVDESGLSDFAGQGSGLSAEPGPLFRSGHLKHLAMRAGDVVSAPTLALCLPHTKRWLAQNLALFLALCLVRLLAFDSTPLAVLRAEPGLAVLCPLSSRVCLAGCSSAGPRRTVR
eukprot:COSAG04_NODE_4436_length_2093_cov_1.984453_3_plen_119_part_00